jgi:hypothetical protein
MQAKEVLKKLNQKLDARRTELIKKIKLHQDLKRAKSEDDKVYYKSQLERLSIRNISGLPYKVRANYFESRNVGFNPETFEGHSYRWYSLVRKFNIAKSKSVVVLNTYNYSFMTVQHKNKVGLILEDLGIPYKTLRAPQGLQDLSVALKYEVSFYAQELIRAKYSRGQTRGDSYFKNRMLRSSTPELKLLASLGYKASQRMRLKALADAEQQRLDRNNRIREKAALKRASAGLSLLLPLKLR